MLYRAATLAIALFWLVMTALLVRLQTNPDGADILGLPVSYVTRLVFRNSQPSLLTILELDKPIGALSLRPSNGPAGAHRLDLSGAVSLQLSLGGPRQRVNFSGSADLDPAFTLTAFQAGFTLPQPHTRIDLAADLRRRTLHYEVRQGDSLIASQSLPLDSAQLLPALLSGAGIDPHSIPILAMPAIAPSLTAREARITLRGEQLEVCRLSLSQGSAILGSAYITQLGQVVLARTSFGYSLAAEDLQ